MRTTVAIDDHLLAAAKARAREQGGTLGQLVEAALRRELSHEEPSTGVPLPVFTSGTGPRPGVDLRSNRVPTPIGDSLAFATAVRSQPGHLPAEPGPRHRDCLQEACRRGEVTADLLPDAVLAAIALEHGATVVSFDRDFARFDGLGWLRPT
ncbi:MAG TPA: PIN domain-containing protein [Acidimicrobiales bacterium]|nr:PIN domain-containing protein [Acidimicrobiales bacterium]